MHDIPAATANLFEEVVRASRKADEVLARRTAAVSPMLRVGQFAEEAAVTQQIQGLQERLRAMQAAVEASLPALNEAWEQTPPGESVGRPAALPLDRLETLWRELSYLNRWGRQLHERLVRLAT